MHVVSDARPIDGGYGAWVEGSSSSAPSRKCGPVKVNTGGSEKGEGRGKLPYNSQYNGCGGHAATSNDRKWLCPSNGSSSAGFTGKSETSSTRDYRASAANTSLTPSAHVIARSNEGYVLLGVRKKPPA